MKRLFSSVLLCLLLFCSCAAPTETVSSQSAPAEEPESGVFTYAYADFINGDDAVVPLAAPDECLYHYGQLREAETDYTWAYDALAYEATHFSNRVDGADNVSAVYFPYDISPEQLTAVYNCFHFDHPELWYLFQSDKNGCVPDGDNPRIAYLTYSDPIDRLPALNEEIAAAADRILADGEAKKLVYDIDREAYLSNYLYETVTIDWDLYNEIHHSSPKELLLEHNGVCIGFAMTTVYLLQRWGIRAVTGHGHVASGMVHCFAITEKDGQYVYTDTYNMRHRGDGIERSAAEFFCFDSLDVYRRDGTTVDAGVLLPGSPVGAGETVTEQTYE